MNRPQKTIRKLSEYVGDNPNYRWKGYYKVKYKGKWIVAKWEQTSQEYSKHNWHWLLADGTWLCGDSDFEIIIEKRIKEF